MVVGDEAFADALDAARRGDPDGWALLYHDIAPLVIGYLRAQDLPDPEDVAGEVLLEVVRGLPRFSGHRANFRSWVLTIAHHRLLDARRRARRRPVSATAEPDFDRPGPAQSPEEIALATAGLGHLRSALDTLTDEQRTVLLLRVIGDLPIAEVARITGRREGAVKQLQRRAVDAMRAVLDTTDESGVPAASRCGTSAQRTPRDVLPRRGASHAVWSG